MQRNSKTKREILLEAVDRQESGLPLTEEMRQVMKEVEELETSAAEQRTRRAEWAAATAKFEEELMQKRLENRVFMTQDEISEIEEVFTDSRIRTPAGHD